MTDNQNPYAAPQTGVSPPVSANPSGLISPYGPMRNTKTLGRVVQISIGVQLALLLIYAGLSFYLGAQSAREIDVFVQADGVTQTPFFWFYSLFALVMVAVFILSVVVFCIWTNKSMKNAWALRKDMTQPTMKPGWAVGFYFIPIALLWKPFQGMREIWQVTFQDSEGAHLGLLRWWWGFWLLGNFADNIAMRLPTETFAELATSAYFDGVGAIPSLIAGVLIIIIVGKVTAQQMARSAESAAI